MKRALLLVVLTGTLVLQGCGYALVGRSNFLDPSIRTIEVPAFINRTTRVELEQRVTQAVSEEFVSRGRLRLVNDRNAAHVVLRGSIDTFNIFPVAFDEGRATRYQISITAAIELLDHRNEDKVLWKNDQYRFTENYEVNLGTTDAFDQETRAIQEIAVRFAEGLVTNLLEGF
ncbi:MAG TPA: LPS assembly lipoprotein LptE [Thermoanaerobaculia bacterium]|nr:LPS assembly lipoprotein LptE [Thermoanaerobaculia bacterium]